MKGYRAVADVYDALLRGENAKVNAGNFAIHKNLTIPAEWRKAGLTCTNDWIVQQASLNNTSKILDAGCGVGGTLFALVGEVHQGLGITLSNDQRRVAETQASQLGLERRVRFLTQSYDQPLRESFDLIVAIEALLHSHDLRATIANLSRHLNPGGRLILLEDMAELDISDDPLAGIWSSGWALTRVYTREEFEEAIQGAGLVLERHQNFTPMVKSRRWPGGLLRALSVVLGHGVSKRRIFLGGLALEHLYRSGKVCYRFLCAKRSNG
tara:strand:+ start:940 stop:1743 length:804 start_codon:yes stop_codon:yes gene_type:complete